MKKKLFILAVVSLMVCLIGFVAIACACDDDGDGKSKQGHLDFYQKCSLKDNVVVPDVPFCHSGVSVPVPPLGDLDLNPVKDKGKDKDRAWGKLEYKLSGPIFKFEFEGHGLKPLDPGDRSYTLIYYPENYNSGSGLIYFGSGVADNHGDVQIEGSLDTGSLPGTYTYDINCIWDSSTMTCLKGSGAKIWLVLSSDICFRSAMSTAPVMINWNPEKYLFGAELITFNSPEDRDCGN